MDDRVGGWVSVAVSPLFFFPSFLEHFFSPSRADADVCGDGEAGRRGGRGARDTAGQWQWQWRPRRWALLRGIYYYFIIFRGSVLLASEEREKVRERGGEVKGYSHTHHPCPFPHTPRHATPRTPIHQTLAAAGRPAGRNPGRAGAPLPTTRTCSLHVRSRTCSGIRARSWLHPPASRGEAPPASHARGPASLAPCSSSLDGRGWPDGAALGAQQCPGASAKSAGAREHRDRVVASVQMIFTSRIAELR